MHQPKRCPAFGKECYHYKKKNHFSNMCRSRHHSQSNGNSQRSQSQNSRFSCKDHHELESSQTYDDSKWYSYEQESVRIQLTSKHLYHTKPMNIMFDEIDQENMPRVLADLHVSQCDGPKDSLAMPDVHVHVQHFKIDSRACGNLIPLSLYLDLFPNSSVKDLWSTIDHRVQLVAYSKNLTKQYGTCYLKVKSNGHVYICKFCVVDSCFNPIIGVGSCVKLGLIQFQNPVYTGWNDDRPVSIGRHVDTVGTGKSMKTGDVLICAANAKPMSTQKRKRQIKCSIHINQRLDCFKPKIQAFIYRYRSFQV